jgi:hypothetical protein
MMHDGELWERATPGLRTREKGYGSLRFPTPKATEARCGYSSHDGAPSLGKMAKEGWWPTPRASEAGPDFAKLNRSKTGISLQTAVAMWPTPKAIDGKPVAALWKGHGEIFRTKNGTLRRLAKTGSDFGVNLPVAVGGSLNPTWVEWLMGWPLGWTDCAVSGMAKFQEWRKWHGGF